VGILRRAHRRGCACTVAVVARLQIGKDGLQRQLWILRV
jgi:hypothetical protein